mmetsp:Transcript_13265/g.24894  ORF Transcript_13265/g.24894 Transcript_13265/m.24894 type:complete len:203 (+) Transcript_13265:348-956(+)
MKMILISLLHLCQMYNLLYTRTIIPQNNSIHIQILPNNQIFHSTKIQSLESILHPKTIFGRIQTYLLHIPLKQPLLLHQLDRAKCIRRQLNRLIKPLQTTIRNIHHLDHNLLQTWIKKIRTHKLRLKIRRSCQNQSLDIGPLPIGHKQLRSHLRHLSDIIMSLFQTKTCKTQCRLSSPPMLFGKIHGEFVEYFTVASLYGTV